VVKTITLILNFTVLLLSSLSGIAGDKSQLKLVLDNTPVELGEPVGSTIYGINLPREIMLSDLHILKSNFGIKTEEEVETIQDTRWPGQHVQVLRFELYPRNTGTLKVEQLNIGDTYSQVASIKVIDGKVKGKNIELQTSVSTNSPWERQQVLFELEITTPELFASLSTEEIINNPGHEIVALPTSKQRTTNSKGEQLAVLKMAWAIFPLIPGEHHINLPKIQYNLSGQVRRHYFLPNLQLNARALPPYVPPTMPIASIAINSSVNASSPLDTDSLFYWQITIKSAALKPYWLPPVLHQVSSNEQLSFLQIESKRTMQPDKSGVHGQVTHHLPFKAKRSGIISLPELRLQTFDPNSGRLTIVTHPSQRFFVLSQNWRWLLGGIFVLFLFWIIKRVFQYLHFKMDRHKKRKFALKELKQSKDALTLRAAIKLLGEAEGLPYNLSLSEWADSYRDNFNTEFEQTVTRVSRFCYSDSKEDDLGTIRSNLLIFLKK